MDKSEKYMCFETTTNDVLVKKALNPMMVPLVFLIDEKESTMNFINEVND
jgi:hypothetical protein